jgi:hypothetical protein
MMHISAHHDADFFGTTQSPSDLKSFVRMKEKNSPEL